jgi:hypothetical protein
MIRMMFECPTTGRPLSRIAVEDWVGESPDMILAVHCSSCSGLHHFRRSDAILELSTAFTRDPRMPARAPLRMPSAAA